jgi:O-antigen/teichoic acid export membrane protein
MRLARNILTTFSARLALLGVSLISSVVLARYLGPEGRGLFALVLLLPELARSLALLGFEQANAVYAGLEPRGRRALVWQSVATAGVVGGTIAASTAVFLALGAPGFPTLLRGSLWLYLLPVAGLPIALLIEYWQAIIRGMNHIFLLNAEEVAAKIASLILVLMFVVWWRLGVAGAVWANFITTVGTLLALLGLLIYVRAWGNPSFDLKLWRRITRFALPAHGGTVAAYLNYRVDEIIVAVLLPPAQLGFYVIATGLAERIWLLPGSVATALLPHLSNTPDRDRAFSAAIARHLMIWVGAACLLLWVSASFAVKLLYSSEFSPVVPALRWLLPGIFTLSIGKVLVAELLAQEKPSYTIWASGAAGLVNIAANLVLVPRLGITGASLASSISYTLLSFILTWSYLRETGLSWAVLVPRLSDLKFYSTVWRRSVVAAPVGGTPGGNRP